MQILSARSVVAGALVAALILGVILAFATGGTAADTSEPLYLREARVEPAEFTFGSLHDHDELLQLDELRRAEFDRCMAGRGFSEPPKPEEYREDRLTENARGYAIAAGDDPTRTEPPDIENVTLPDGSSVQLGTTMTAESCRWQADSYPLGVDPLYREAMRIRLDELRIEADLASFADRDAKPVLSEFFACSGLDDPWALLAASGTRISGDPRAGATAKARECATEELAAELDKVRAQYHYSIATRDDTERLISAWVDLVDAELAAIDR